MRHRRESGYQPTRSTNPRLGMTVTSQWTLLAVPAVLLVVCCCSPCCGLAVDTASPVTVLQPPALFSSSSNGTTGFGYTLAFQGRDPQDQVLLVGAPGSSSSQEGVTSPGALYSCTVGEAPTVGGTSASRQCQRLDVDTSSREDKYVPSSYLDNKDFQRLGATLSVEEEGVLVCAPNWSYDAMNKYSFRWTAPVGKCFYSSSGWQGQFSAFSPPVDIAVPGANLRYVDDGYCQAGFSAALTGQGAQVVLGSPGCMAWTGDVLQGLPGSDAFRRKGGSYTEQDFIEESDRRSIIPQPHNKYLGYAVAGQGVFGGSVAVVASAPKSIVINFPSPTGQAVVGATISILSEYGSSFRVWQQLYPPQSEMWYFAYCGFSLAVGDVNNDGLDDVVVGCPLYGRDQGAILVYYQQQDGAEYKVVREQVPWTRNATDEGARYGTSVTIIDDLDGDGYKELVVGAPSAGHQSGVLYIYCTQQGELPLEPCQTVRGPKVNTLGVNATGFGWAVASAADPTMSGRRLLAVADPEGEAVMVLRTLPVVALEVTVHIERMLDFETTCTMQEAGGIEYPCAEIAVCVKYTLRNGQPQQLSQAIAVTVEVKLDTSSSNPKLKFDDGSSKRLQDFDLRPESTRCQSMTVFDLKKNEKIVEYEISAEMAGKLDSSLKMVLDTRSGLSSSSTLLTVVECDGAGTESCRSDVLLQLKPHTPYSYPDDLVVEVTLTNTGDPAVYPKLLMSTGGALQKSGDATVEGAVNKCTEKNTNITCSLGGIMNKGTAKLTFRLSLTKSFIDNQEKEEPHFTITASFLTTSTIVRPDSATATARVPINIDPVLELSKSSSPDRIDFTEGKGAPSSPSAVAQLGPVVQHQYDLDNKNQYPVYGASLYINWPLRHKNGEYLLYVAEPPRVMVARTPLQGACEALEGGQFDPLNLLGSSTTETGGPDLAGARRTAGITTLPALNVGNSSVSYMTIRCRLGDLQGEQGATITVLSYAVYDTFSQLLENRISTVYSLASATVDHIPFGEPFSKKITAKIGNTVEYPEPASNTWWIVLLGVLIGLLIIGGMAMFMIRHIKAKKAAQADGTDGGTNLGDGGADGAMVEEDQPNYEEEQEEQQPMNVSDI